MPLTQHIKPPMKDSLKNQIYQKLKQDILLCKILPGDRLFDKDLAAQMRVSRTPVREALLLLEKDRLLTAENRSGFVVRRMTIAEISQFFDIREALLDYAAGLMAQNATSDDIKLMEAQNEIAEKCYNENKMEDFVLSCAAFHKALREATHSEIYVRVMEDLNDIMTLFRAMTLNMPDSAATGMDEHRQIVETLKKADKPAIKEALANHLEGPRKYMRYLATYF